MSQRRPRVRAHAVMCAQVLFDQSPFGHQLCFGVHRGAVPSFLSAFAPGRPAHRTFYLPQSASQQYERKEGQIDFDERVRGLQHG